MHWTSRLPADLKKSRGRWLLAIALVLGLTACAIPGNTPSNTAAWKLGPDSSLKVEPGQTIRFKVILDRADISPYDLALWVGHGSEKAIRLPLNFIEGQEKGSNRSIFLPAPGVMPGSYTLHLGDAEGPKSNSVNLEILPAQRRMSKQAAAQLIARGLAGFAAQAWGVINNPAPSLEAFRKAAYSDTFWQSSAAFFAGLETLGAKAGQAYLALPDEVELQFQAYLYHSGFLDLLSKLENSPTPTAVSALGVVSDQRKTEHHYLMGLDLLGGYIHSLQVGTDIATILLLVGGVTIPAAEIPAIASLIGRAIRLWIETYTPTDLVALEPHADASTYENHPVQAVYWGHFRPQEKVPAGLTSWGIDTAFGVLKLGISALFPKATSKLLSELLEFVIAKVQAHILAIPAIVLSANNPGDYYTEKKVALYMQLYNLTYADLAKAVSFYLGPFHPFVYAPAVIWSYTAINPAASPVFTARRDENSSLGGGTFTPTPDTDTFTFSNLPCFDGTKGLLLMWIKAQTYRLESRGNTWYDIPWPKFLEPVEHFVSVVCNNSKDPWYHPSIPTRFFNLNFTKLIYDQEQEGWVVKGAQQTKRDRVYRIVIEDGSLCRDLGKYPTVTVKSPGSVIGPIRLENTNRLETVLAFPASTNPHQLYVSLTSDCDKPLPGHPAIRLRLIFPDSIAVNNANGNNTVYFITENQAQPVNETLLVWVPPDFN